LRTTWIIARRELTDISRDGRFRVSAAIIFSLLLVSLAAGWSHQRAVSAIHRDAEHAVREQWLAQPPKDPHSAAHYSSYVFKPREPLTLFDSGVDPFTGVAAWLEAHKQNEFQFRPAQDRTSLARFGELSASATLQLLVPIVIILLTFATFAGEREDGTLRQVIATGVAPWRLGAGKVAGAGLALGTLLLPAAILGAGAIALASSDGSIPIDRVTALAVTYGAYFLVILVVALTVSALARTSTQALALLMAFWLLNTIVAPRLASAAAVRLHPAPTAFAFAKQVERDTYNGLTVHEYFQRHASDLRARLLAQHKVSAPQDLPVNFRGVDYMEREAHSSVVWDRHYRDLWDQFERQIRTQQAAAFAAPLLGVQALSMSLAGTDFFHHLRFASAAEAYRRQLVDHMNAAIANNSTSQQLNYVADDELWRSVPPFAYRTPGADWALRNSRTSQRALAGWMALGAVLLAWSVRRLRVD